MPKDTFRIEHARRSDAEWIAQAQIAMALETEELELEPEVVARGVHYVFDHPDRGFYLIARDGLPAEPSRAAAVGCLLVLREWSDWRNADVWWLHSLYVSREWRRRGVFRRLYAHLESEARAAGARGIRLLVDHGNQSAQVAYREIGMTSEHYETFEILF